VVPHKQERPTTIVEPGRQSVSAFGTAHLFADGYPGASRDDPLIEEPRVEELIGKLSHGDKAAPLTCRNMIGEGLDLLRREVGHGTDSLSSKSVALLLRGIEGSFQAATIYRAGRPLSILFSITTIIVIHEHKLFVNTQCRLDIFLLTRFVR